MLSFLNVVSFRFMHGHVPGAINLPYSQTFTPDANNVLANYKGCKLTVVMGKSSENESQVILLMFLFFDNSCITCLVYISKIVDFRI